VPDFLLEYWHWNMSRPTWMWWAAGAAAVIAVALNIYARIIRRASQ
jgi:hypothetical protein